MAYQPGSWRSAYYLSGWNPKLLPRNWAKKGYGTNDYQSYMREIYGNMTGEEDADYSAAWDEFSRYLTNSMLGYMTGKDAQQHAQELRSQEADWYAGVNLDTWDDLQNGAGGRTMDNWYDSAVRWDAVGQGLNDAMSYLWGNITQEQNGETTDSYEASMAWLNDLVGLGKKYGLKSPDQVRTRSETADMSEAWERLVDQADSRGVHDSVRQLGENLWGFTPITTPTSQLGYRAKGNYQWTPNASGNGAFYSYRNARYT